MTDKDSLFPPPFAASTAERGSASVSSPASSHASARGRLHYIQAMRALAIAVVVTTHCTALFPPGDWVRSDAVHFFFRHINVVFTFVSGFLFQFLIGKYRYESYLRTKVNNVLIPYLIVSFPALMIYVIGLKPLEIDPEFGQHGPLVLAAYMLATGTHLGPLWFIPMISILFIASPVLKWIDDNPRRYLLIVPALALACVVGRSPADVNPIQNAVFYLPVYLVGMAMSRIGPGGGADIAPSWSWLIPLVFVPAFIPSHIAGWDSCVFVTKILFCCGLVGLLSRYATSVPRWVDDLGKASFGIFFVHGYAIAALVMISVWRITGLTGMAGLLIYAVAVLGASLASVMVVKKLTGTWSRRIIGV